MPDDTDERILGDAGDDTIDAQGGSDTVFGDAGDDTLSGGEGRDIIRGGSGDDTIRGNDDGDILLGDSGEDTIYGGEGNDLVVGGSGNDTLYGDAGDDTLVGGLGDDSLTGGTGSDTFVFTANTGSDTITDFDKDNDTIDLSMLPEAIAFSELTLTALTDGRTGTVITHSALTGSITVLGMNPADFTAAMFDLPDGSTTSTTTAEGDTVQLYENPWEGTESSDILIDQSNSTRMVGLGGNDRLLGGEGDDVLEGGAGDDALMGEEGDDTLDGGADDDVLYGGSGADKFVFQAGHGTDTVLDFTIDDDTIDLSAFTGISGFSDLTITPDGTTAVIDLSSHGGGTIRLENVTDTDLDAGDFTFYDTMDG